MHPSLQKCTPGSKVGCIGIQISVICQSNIIRTKSSLWETGSDYLFISTDTKTPTFRMALSSVPNPNREDRERRKSAIRKTGKAAPIIGELPCLLLCYSASCGAFPLFAFSICCAFHSANSRCPSSLSTIRSSAIRKSNPILSCLIHALCAIDTTRRPPWGCMKGPQPLHLKSAAATCAARGTGVHRRLWRMKVDGASGIAGSALGATMRVPRKAARRFRYHLECAQRAREK